MLTASEIGGQFHRRLINIARWKWLDPLLRFPSVVFAWYFDRNSFSYCIKTTIRSILRPWTYYLLFDNGQQLSNSTPAWSQRSLSPQWGGTIKCLTSVAHPWSGPSTISMSHRNGWMEKYRCASHMKLHGWMHRSECCYFPDYWYNEACDRTWEGLVE